MSVWIKRIAAAGFLFFWFPPMYLVSAIAVYLAVRAFMEELARKDTLQ